MATKQEMLDFLKDTCNFYTSNNRSLDIDDVCIYSPTSKSPGCAIGRHIEDKQLCRQLDDDSELFDAQYELFPEKLKRFNLQFLLDIQNLHDIDDNWNKNGLTLGGMLEKAIIEEKIMQEEY